MIGKRKPLHKSHRQKTGAAPFASYDRPNAITPIEYSGLQTAFDHLNCTLFDGTLPDVFMTHQRRANSYGYFAPERYADRGDASCRHEIALNPDSFVGESDREVISTLLHEMVHLWQHVHGVQRPRRAYHNREWAAKMCELGLMPSSTGKPGGQMTGSRMSHYVLEDGRYAQGFAALAATGWKLNLQSAARPSVIKGPGSKSRFTCPGCSWNVWGKPDTRVACLYCDMQMALSG